MLHAGFSRGNALLVAVGALLLTACALRASRHLHETLLRRVVRSPMSFFDSTATGIIMNRMLQDIQNVDQYVPNSILDLSTKILTMVAQLALILAFAYWVLLALPVLLPLYVAVLHRVRPAARDTRRIESVAHSPVYTHFGDAIRGIETVAAFGKSARARFFARNEALVGAMSRAKIGNDAVCKWAQVLSTQLGCALYFFTGVACVVLNGRGDISASQLGLVLLYTGVLQRSVMAFMMQLTVVETQFVSVERVAEYSRLEGEPPDGDFAPPPGWPFAGEIRIQNVSLRYRVFSPPVLRGLALSIAPRSKTALCGRTGCGKSSLFGALCRLYPVCAGQILIDGVDLASLCRRAARCASFAGRAAARHAAVEPRRARRRQRAAAARRRRGRQTARPVGGAERVGCARARDPPRRTAHPAWGGFSEGERQLPRSPRFAAADRTRVLLCDEPTSNVDLAATRACTTFSSTLTRRSS